MTIDYPNAGPQKRKSNKARGVDNNSQTFGKKIYHNWKIILRKAFRNRQMLMFWFNLASAIYRLIMFISKLL